MDSKLLPTVLASNQVGSSSRDNLTWKPVCTSMCWKRIDQRRRRSILITNTPARGHDNQQAQRKIYPNSCTHPTLETTTGWSLETSAAWCRQLKSCCLLYATFIAAPDSTYDGRISTGYPTEKRARARARKIHTKTRTHTTACRIIKSLIKKKENGGQQERPHNKKSMATTKINTLLQVLYIAGSMYDSIHPQIVS